MPQMMVNNAALRTEALKELARRNYLDYFYHYYREIGATHFLYLDNGSTDDSLDKLSKWKNSIILKSEVCAFTEKLNNVTLKSNKNNM